MNKKKDKSMKKMLMTVLAAVGAALIGGSALASETSNLKISQGGKIEVSNKTLFNHAWRSYVTTVGQAMGTSISVDPTASSRNTDDFKVTISAFDGAVVGGQETATVQHKVAGIWDVTDYRYFPVTVVEPLRLAVGETTNGVALNASAAWTVAKDDPSNALSVEATGADPACNVAITGANPGTAWCWMNNDADGLAFRGFGYKVIVHQAHARNTMIMTNGCEDIELTSVQSAVWSYEVTGEARDFVTVTFNPDDQVDNPDASAVVARIAVDKDAAPGSTFTVVVGNDYFVETVNGIVTTEDTVALNVDRQLVADSLATAFSAANSGETIQLLRNWREHFDLTEGKVLTLDLRGNTLEVGAGTDEGVDNDLAKLTITNGTLKNVVRVDRGEIWLSGITAADSKPYLQLRAGSYNAEKPAFNYEGKLYVLDGDYRKATLATQDNGKFIKGLRLRGGVFSTNLTEFLDREWDPTLVMVVKMMGGEKAWTVSRAADVAAMVVSADGSVTNFCATLPNALECAEAGERVIAVKKPADPLDLAGLKPLVDFDFGTNRAPNQITVADGKAFAITEFDPATRLFTSQAVEADAAVATTSRGEGATPASYTNILTSLSAAGADDVITLVGDLVTRRLKIDFATTNTVDLAGNTWEVGAGTDGGLQAEGAQITIRNGVLKGLLRADHGEYALNSITASVERLTLRAPETGRIFVYGDDFTSAVTNNPWSAGVRVRGGKYAEAYWKDFFDTAWGEANNKVFAQTGAETWEVIDKAAAKWWNAGTGVHYPSDELAFAQSGKFDTLVYPGAYGGAAAVTMDDPAILKQFKFDLSGLDTPPTFTAVRHNEFYELKDNGDGTYSFFRKDPPSRKLSFVIEGAGRVYVDDKTKEIDHTSAQGDVRVAYKEVTAGVPGHTLYAVAEANGGQGFLLWCSNTFANATADEIAADPANTGAGDWLPFAYADSVDFVMPEEDTVLKAVFVDAPVTNGTITIVADPIDSPRSMLTGATLDGAALGSADGNRTFTASAVKETRGQIYFHDMSVTPRNPGLFTMEWLDATGVTVREGDNPRTFYYSGEDTVITAKFTSVANITCADVEKTYDGQPTNITVKVEDWDATTCGDWTIQYRTSEDEDWSDTNPPFTNVAYEDGEVSHYTVYWRVLDRDGFVHKSDSNTVTINRKDTEGNVRLTWVEECVYDGEEQTPDFTLYDGDPATDGVELTKDVDYTLVGYGNNTNATEAATITVSYIGNYEGENDVFTFTIKPADISTATLEISGAPFFATDPRSGIEPDVTVTLGAKELEKDTEYGLTYENNEEPSQPGELAKAIATGTGNYTGAVTNTFTIFGGAEFKSQHEGQSQTPYFGKCHFDATNPDADGKIPTWVYDVRVDTGMDPAMYEEFEVPAEFTKDDLTYKVVGIMPGAFTNAPNLVNLKIDGLDTKILGNIVWGLEKLQWIDFPGDDWTKSPYYFQKLGADEGGVGILYRRMDSSIIIPGSDQPLFRWDDPLSWINVELLGVTDSADVFELPATVRNVHATAFAGNERLEEIALGSAAAAWLLNLTIDPDLTDWLDTSKVIFSCEALLNPNNEPIGEVMAGLGLMWYNEAGTRWITIDVDAAEAKIVTPSGAQRFYLTLGEALGEATAGETVTVLKDVTGGEYANLGNRIAIDATGHSLTNVTLLPNDLRIVGGTFDVYYEDQEGRNYLAYPERDTMACNGDGTWTVVRKEDVVCTLRGPGVDSAKDRFMTVAAAFATAEDGQTITFVQQPSDPLDLTDWPTGKLGIKLIGEEGLSVPAVIDTPAGYKCVRNVDDGTVSLAANEDVAAKIERGEGKTPKFYRSVEDGLSEAVRNENVRLLRDCGEELLVAEAKVNTIGLNGKAWTNGFVQVENAAAKITIQNGTFMGSVNVNAGMVVLKNVTAENGFKFDAPNANGRIYVKSGDYVAAVNGGIAGVVVQGGTFSYDFLNSGNFDDQGGTKAFVRIGEQLWEVMDSGEPTVKVTKNGKTDFFTDMDLALKTAKKGATVTLLANRAEDIVLGDAVIAKNLKFDLNGKTFEGSIVARRHAEFYRVDTNAVNAVELMTLVLKDMPTHRLSFTIEGAGRVYVDGQDARHLEEGDKPQSDYSSLVPGAHSLEAIVEVDSGATFYAWYEKDENGGWVILRDEYGYRCYGPSVAFDMPNRDTELKLVFQSKDAYRQVDELTVRVEPSGTSAEVKIDGVAGAFSGDTWTFANVKYGEHLFESTPVEGLEIEWVTNGVSCGRLGSEFETTVGDGFTNVVVRYLPVAEGAVEDVEKTYDLQPTNIVVEGVITVPGLEGCTVWYKDIDRGGDWTTTNPTFTDAGDWEVQWEIRWGEAPYSVVASGDNFVTIDPKDLHDADIEVTLDEYYFENDGSAHEPAVTVVWRGMGEDGDDLVLGEDLDYTVDYTGNDRFATAHALVSGLGNYTTYDDEDDDENPVDVKFFVMEKVEVPADSGEFFYLQKAKVDGTFCAAVADVQGKAGRYDVPKKVTSDVGGTSRAYTVMDVLPGAFRNSPELTYISFKNCDKLNIWGNIIWGLEKLEYIDFPGATPDDSEYYYSKLAEAYNGAGVLVKRNDDANALPWNDVTLLGVAAAGDTFEVSNVVTRIAKTAFFGNDKLERIVLHNGIRAIEEGFTEELDLSKVVFVMNEEPSDDIKAMFAKELDADGEPIEWTQMEDGTWVTFNWSKAEAMIETQLGAKRGFQTFAAAVEAAREGETVTVLRDITGDVTLTRQLTVTTTNDDTKVDITFANADEYLQVVRGVYNANYTANLVERDPALTMERFVDANGKWWYKVIESTAVQAIAYTAADKSDALAFATLQDAADWVKTNDLVGATIAVVTDETVEEDVTIEKSLTFDFTGKSWKGHLTVVAGSSVTVNGQYAEADLVEKAFSISGEGGQLVFNYNPSQASAADGFHIANGGGWWYLSALPVVAQETDNDEELFDSLQTAADLGIDFTVVLDNGENINPTADFTIRTASDVVYTGWIFNDSLAAPKTVKTSEGSVFSQNLIDEFDWSNGLTLEVQDTDPVTYKVVEAKMIVARFVFDDGRPVVNFTDPSNAVAAVKSSRPIAEFQIGLNDSSCTYDFLDADGKKGEKKDGASATFAKLVVFGKGTNTIENAILRGKAAVTAPRGGDAAGTVVFGEGVRMTNSNTAFTDGDVELIVKAGAYINDPTEYCEPGYTAARRAKTGSELDGYYVIYPCDEAEVTVTDADGHHIHYKTIQDAFDLENGGTIQLFNNGPVNATLPAGKSFTLTSDPNGAGRIEGGARKITGGMLTVYGNLTIRDVDCTGFRIVTWKNRGATVTIGDNVTMRDATGGAIWMAAGNTLNVDTQGAYIYDNKTVVGGNEMQYNVILENDEILVLKQPLYTGKIGVSLLNVWPFQSFAGRPFGRAESFYSDGDIFFPEQRFVNDYDPTMSSGKGTGLEQKPGFNYMRWVGDYDHVLTEGIWLLSRTGDRLVWLEIPAAPADTLDDLDQEKDELFVGRTAYTITIRPVLSDAYGRDYAIIESGTAPAVTNWVSITDTEVGVDSLVWNANDRTFTFEALKKNTVYTLVSRRSISPKNTVSDVHVCGEARTAKYDAMEIAKMFYDNVSERFPKMPSLAETAGNADFVTVTTAGNAGNGYVVTLRRDLGRGAVLRDDMGAILLKMNGNWLNARAADENGIRFVAAADYNENLPTELTVVNDTLGKPGRIVGAAGADGNATDANGKNGAAGMSNTSGNLVYVEVNGGVEVYGGKGGNGASRVDGQAGNGGNGGDAVVGVIDLTVNGAVLTGGNGGFGGDSTNGNGGNGGFGGQGVGEAVTGTVVTGEIYGGQGGNGGGGVTAGNGGNGGDALSNLEGMIVQGGDTPEDITVIAGKGGVSADPAKAGQDGKGGKPEAPTAPTVKYLTGESATLNVEPNCEYLVFKTADGEPSVEDQVWIKTGPQETTIYVDRDTLNRVLVKDTNYTVYARKPADGENLVSFYSTMAFTTLGHDASDLVTLFKGKATAAEKDGIYVVTLTDDIKEGLEIPDNLGVFKLDMQGWSITGRNGNAAAGELDGEAAITFTAANDDPSTLTRMIIVGNGDNAIVGGNGDNAIDSLDDADGDNGGEGGNGFAVADNLVKRVVVDFENGTLAGGNGGKGADSVNGNGGDGGNGGDAYDDIRLTVVIGRDALALGGNGGKGGDVYGGIAGNGGNGGNAMWGEGGNGGQRGIARGAGGQDGQDGVGGDGIIPGGAPEAYLVKLTGASHADRFFTTFEEGILYAENGDTLTVVRDCVFDSDDYGEVEVTANDLTIATAPGVTLTWNGTLRVASGVTGFVVEGEMSEAGAGTLIVDGEATLGKGMIANLEISFEGQVELSGATVGKVAIEQGGRLTVPVNATSLIKEGIVSDQGGFADKSGVFLFGGLYGFDPGLYRRDPFMVVTEGNLWRIVQDPKFTAMAQVGTKIWGIETIDEAFAEIRKAAGPILVYLLKDSVANGVLTDQAWTDAVIIGNGYTIVDARKDAACEVALFNLSGNLVLRNVTFDGQGTQKGKFIELFEAKTVVMDGCTVTGYACEALNGVDGKLQLISAAAAGMTTMLVLKDTTISGNDVSCAVSLTDRSGSGFEYQLHLSGATTIADNGGNGIVANKFGTIVMADDLTGGYIDVAYTGLADGKFGLAANKYLDGADHFRSEATKECGSVVEEGGKAYVKWGVDERQYAAKIGTVLYDTIEKALEAVQDGDTLTLMQDAEITRTVTVRLRDSNESFTLDLNGKTLTNSANKLKFGTGTVTIRNGTLAKNDTKYALYLYGAAVQLEDVTVDSDIYVARGWLVIGDEDVKVKGVIAKTNAGSISISEGLYTENPSEYVVSGRTVAAGSYGEYAWKVVPAAEPVGFADGFVLDTTPDKDGNIALDFTTRDTFGVLRDGAKVILNGYVVNKVSVETPKGWKSTVTYDPTNGKTVVLFAMDNAVLKPELGTDNPGDRPFEVVTAAGQVTQITLRVKNAVKGFWYQLMAANDLGQTFQVATEVQATQDGNLAITLKTSKDKFFKLNVSDRQAK